MRTGTTKLANMIVLRDVVAKMMRLPRMASVSSVTALSAQIQKQAMNMFKEHVLLETVKSGEFKSKQRS